MTSHSAMSDMTQIEQKGGAKESFSRSMIDNDRDDDFEFISRPGKSR